MADQLLPIPQVPDGLREAAQRGILIPFVGAGVSRLAGCPDWAQFADSALQWLIERGVFSYAQLDQIRHLNPRVKLSLARSLERDNGISIDFHKLLHPTSRRDNAKGIRLYNSLFKLGKTFVTTNYDKWLDERVPQSIPSAAPEVASKDTSDGGLMRVVYRVDHAEAWLPVKVLFEAELRKCKNANYEFSTLAAAYLPQLFYMDGEWTRANIGRIFPSESPSNSICAIDGLAYAQFTRPVYQSLAEQGVLDRALRYELRGRNSREKLLERIAAGYLWEEEGLDSSRFAYIFDTGRVDDLEVIARVFWTVRDTQLSDAQKERVIQYWQRCVAWSQGLPKPPATLLSALSTLSCYVSTADGREKELLEAVAPYIYDGYNSDEFFAELLRLVNVSPDGVSAILGKAIESRAPSFDFEDRLKSLLRQLAGKGRKQDAILYTERLRALGMQELFDELTGSE